MRKIFIGLSLIMIMMLVYISQPKYTVTNVALTKGEAQVASVTSNMAYKFIFEKGKSYDINLYFFRDGKKELLSGQNRIDIKYEDSVVFVGATSVDQLNYSFYMSYGNVRQKLMFPLLNDLEDTPFNFSELGQKQFTMVEGKEYPLCFLGFKIGPSVESDLILSLSEWATLEDKEEIFQELDYVYFVTVNINTDEIEE